MKTKAFYSFEQKLMYFEDDIELIDVLREAVLAGDLTDVQSTKLLKHVNPLKHVHISRRKNSNGGREIAIKHLRASIYSSYIKDVYEEVTEYLKKILQQTSLSGFNSSRIIGDHSFKVEAKAVLALGNWDAVCSMISDSIFQALESERSTLQLIKKIASKLALEIPEALVDKAIPYLEVRHFLVHTDGNLSEEFIRKYPHIRRKKSAVTLDYQLICSFRDSVKALVSAYDQEVIVKNLLLTEYIRGAP